MHDLRADILEEFEAVQALGREWFDQPLIVGPKPRKRIKLSRNERTRRQIARVSAQVKAMRAARESFVIQPYPSTLVWCPVCRTRVERRLGCPAPVCRHSLLRAA